MIITQTPFRMSFFGGGTDMESFFRENGGAVLSTTFDKYCYVNVRHLPRFFDYSTELSYSKTERVTCIEDIQHGTINKYVGFLRNIDDFELIDGVATAIRKINESGYLAIVVTNQPVIARGEVSFDELEEIHNKMETLLGKEGAYLDAIYYCPHHPHKGYEGECPELKIECDCRKPKPGMLLKAAEDYNIDLSQSWMIGDGENDVKAGINAGCKTVLLSEVDENYGQMVTVKSLSSFVNSGMK